MKIIRFAFIVSISITFFSSCEKEVTVKLPPVNTKLVLTCFISPQNKQTEVNVSKSQPIFNNPDYIPFSLPITDATVIISSQNGSWLLPFDYASSGYVIDTFKLKIKAGSTYNLSVSTPDGKFASAVTTIPYFHTTLNYTASMIPTSSTKYNCKLNVHWQDPADSKDYYEFGVSSRIDSSGGYYIRTYCLDDAENSGGVLKRALGVYYDESKNDTVAATLAVITPEYYFYFERLKNYQPDDPFTEPYPMYTNINGGFGIFAGFNKQKVRVLPK